MAELKVKDVKISTVTGYAFQEGINQRGESPWKSLGGKFVLFRSELKPDVKEVDPATNEEKITFHDDRHVMIDMVVGEAATEQSMKKFVSLFRVGEPVTWGMAQSICDVDIQNPIHMVKNEEGNRIVAGANRFVGGLIRYCLDKLAKAPDNEVRDTVRVIFDQFETEEKLIDASNIENVHRHETGPSYLARQAYMYHTRGLSDADIASKLNLPQSKQKLNQYRRVYEWAINLPGGKGKELLDKWDDKKVTLEALLERANAARKPGSNKVTRPLAPKQTRERTLNYARAWDIYSDSKKLDALTDGKSFENPLEAVKYGMRIVMQCAHLEAPVAASAPPRKPKKKNTALTTETTTTTETPVVTEETPSGAAVPETTTDTPEVA